MTNQTFTREFNQARKDQGFKSQAHLDAFYASYDHKQNCPVCSRVRGYFETSDGGMQPVGDSCETGRQLEAASFKF